jgi:hypothetical protein
MKEWIKMRNVKLTETEKQALRRIGRKAYREMVRSVGKLHMAELSKKHGKLGGRPNLYSPCLDRPATPKTPSRHRFKDGICSCGERQKT